jgi:ubiquinone/menaquinone biosynthesis C-methylase UbiE
MENTVEQASSRSHVGNMIRLLSLLRFVCPECGGALKINTELRCGNGHEFQSHGGLWDLLPKSLSKLTKEEGRYHADQKETWVEQNQINTARNLDVHRSFLKFIADRCHPSSQILELGGGVGFDMKLFLQTVRSFQLYVFSEVSLELLVFAQSEVPSDNILFCTVDAQRIPFAENQFDCVFMVAAFHHLPNMDEAVSEITRVTKSGGLIGFGIEPNRWWITVLKRCRSFLRTILGEKKHSAADEEALGLNRADYEELATRHGLTILHLEPVWFLSGYLHYGLELLHRSLRLKKRITLPIRVERLFLAADRIIVTVPGLRRLSWHTSVVYQKA